MLLDRLRELPEIQCYGETSIAFEHAYLKDDAYVCKLIDECKYPYIAFKPLTSSHEVASLLDLRPSARGIWVFRRAEDRANSAVAKFSDDNLDALRRIRSGEVVHTWHARGLSPESRELIAGFGRDDLDAYNAAGLIWLIRNRLYFEQGLDDRSDMLLVAYEDLVSEPDRILRGLCEFLGTEYVERMAAGIHARSVGKTQSRLGAELTDLCGRAYDSLYQQMESEWKALNGGSAQP